MKELKEISFNDSTIILQDNLVRSAILPQKIAELNRNILIKGDTVIEGAVFANKLSVQEGNVEVKGAVYVQQELYVATDYDKSLTFRKTVATADSIASRSPKARLTMCGDVNGRQVTLVNAFVTGSVYADEITLVNCVVIGGAFANQELSIESSIVGTFNSPRVSMAGRCGLLLPSAFSIEPLTAAPGAELYNYSLADLGSLFKGEPQAPESGKIKINFDSDELRTYLSDDKVQKSIRSYSVVGKVLAADLLDTDKFQNHFLLTAAALGPQLLKVYDLGPGRVLSTDNLRAFFFAILNGRITIQDLSGTFSLTEFASKM